MARVTSLVVLAAVTTAVFLLFYQVISPFLLPLFLAIITVILLKPVHDRLPHWLSSRRYAASAVMTIGTLLAVLGPLGLAFLYAGLEAGQLLEQLDRGVIREKLDRARTTAGLDYPFQDECRFIEATLEQLRTDASAGATAVGNPRAVETMLQEFDQLAVKLQDERESGDPDLPDPERVREVFLAIPTEIPGTLRYQQAVRNASVRFQLFHRELLGGPWRQPLTELANPAPEVVRSWLSKLFAVAPGFLATFSGATGSVAARILFDIMVYAFACFFWFADGPQLTRRLMTLSPLDDEYEQQLLHEFEVLVRAVVAGTIASALSQGLLAGVGYWLAGLNSILLLTALSAVFAMVPFVGSSVIWMSVSLWLVFGDGRPVAGILLGLYGLLIISTIDNLIRPWILMEKASLHPLAALIGVLGGVQSLGAIGVFVGPIILAFLQSLLTLLHRELTSIDSTDKAVSPGAASGMA